MENDGYVSIECRILDAHEYPKALAIKIVEEALELADEVRGNYRDDAIKEIADVLEVIESLKEKFQISNDDIQHA